MPKWRKWNTNRNEILKGFSRFYTELYGSTLQDRHPSQKNSNPDTPKIPPIMTSEVKKTLNETKHKALA